jgi:hypothetical protein
MNTEPRPHTAIRALINKVTSSVFGIVFFFCCVLGAVVWIVTPTGSLGSVRDWFDLATVCIIGFAIIPIAFAWLLMVRDNRKFLNTLESPELEKEIHDEIAALESEEDVGVNPPAPNPDAPSEKD